MGSPITNDDIKDIEKTLIKKSKKSDNSEFSNIISFLSGFLITYYLIKTSF